MYLVFGLGNPGPRYEGTRHNIGFMAIARLAERSNVSMERTRFSAKIGTGTLGSESVLFACPQTYMNLSGESVAKAASFFRVDPAGILVIHDELDLPFGTIRVKKGGGVAGHKGLKSIVQALGDPGFIRIRFGIGRPSGRRSVVDYVLSRFDKEEEDALPSYLEELADVVELVIREGVSAAMRRVNIRAKAGHESKSPDKEAGSGAFSV